MLHHSPLFPVHIIYWHLQISSTVILLRWFFFFEIQIAAFKNRDSDNINLKRIGKFYQFQTDTSKD